MPKCHSIAALPVDHAAVALEVLLPAAQAMLDFLSVKGKQFLPRAYSRLRLIRSSVRAKRS
jgi:hypothetical protein